MKMESFKIIATRSDFPDVLLYRNRHEDGSDSVVLLAVGTMYEDEDIFVTEKVIFEDSISASSFIRDFSENSANEWCAKQDILY